MFTPRPYQTDGINAALNFFKGNYSDNAFEILPTGSGKSVVIANIAKELNEPTLVFQPSKEILEQNFAKFCSYGYRAGIYSASAGSKHVDQITFATIGSVAKKTHLFKSFKNIIIDECHLVNSEDGMYQEFIKRSPQAKVLGLTATPYRLTAGFEGAQLKFINRTTPRIFKHLVYYIQNNVLFDAGHLAPLEYFNFDIVDRTMLQMNANGSDFTDASIKAYYREINMPQVAVKYVRMILSKRRNVLVFASLISDAQEISRSIPGSVVLTSETDKITRELYLSRFKNGHITCLINVGVLTTGFDYPALEAVLFVRSTMSLALYYQIVGRVMRPFTYPDGTKKIGWVVDLGGNIKLFGKIETMKIQVNDRGLYSIWNNGRQLTDTDFKRN